LIIIINKKMCQLCGGSVCAGAGCLNLIQHSPEIVKITYSYGNTLISNLQVLFATIITSAKDSLIKPINYTKNLLKK
jgi:hypothetical protein